jgi:hypothetical protein
MSTANASNSDSARSEPRLLQSRPIISIVNRRLEASDHKPILRLASFITSPLCQLHFSLLTSTDVHVFGQSFVNQFCLPSLPSMGAGKPLVFSIGFCLLLTEVASLALLDLAHVHRDHTPQAARRLLGRCCWAERSAGSTLKQSGRSSAPGNGRYSLACKC